MTEAVPSEVPTITNATGPIAGRPVVRSRARIRSAAVGLTLPLFASTIALSAFLLFSVEPLVGRLMLPIFGGTPSVWATVLCFFQAVLLVGYLYGHLSATRLGPRRGAILHAVLGVGALLAAAIAPARLVNLRDPSLPPALNLLGMLVMVVGVPALLLTSTTPLLSSWFSAVRRAAGREDDPYWLYALSNAGSFAALLAYPLAIEPEFGLTAQRGLWAAVLVVLVGGLVACAFVVIRVSRVPAHMVALQSRAAKIATATRTPVEARLPITWQRRARWLLLAAIPSGLLSAVTNFITTDLISTPLLWIGPLAIYLLSFVIAFSERGRRVLPTAERVAPAAITLLWVPFGSAAGWPIGPLLLIELAGLALIATTLHGRLALDRPEPARLTEFYLVLSAGGVLASSFVAIVAPVTFKGVWEYPILLVLALIALAVTRPWGGQARRLEGEGPSAVAHSATVAPARPRLDFSPFVNGAVGRVWPYALAAGAIVIALIAGGSIGLEAAVRWLVVGGIVLLVGAQPRFLAGSTALVLGLAVFVLSPAAVLRDRSFFGVTEVLRPPDRAVTILMNGTTVHGIQSTDPALRRVPSSYYAPNGPFGDIDVLVHGPAGHTGRSIGVVGLGAGTLAAYVGPYDTMTFYEIDPLVVSVASDPRYFTYLSDAPIRPAIVLGDARLSLQDVPGGRFDLLVLDAFSSDAIPAHLLTVEALADDARVIRPGGLLAIHVSNRYYDLAPAVASAAQAVGLSVLQRIYEPSAVDRQRGAVTSHWLAASSDKAALARLAASGWESVRTDVRPLTDDHPDLLRLLRAGIW